MTIGRSSRCARSRLSARARVLPPRPGATTVVLHQQGIELATPVWKPYPLRRQRNEQGLPNCSLLMIHHICRFAPAPPYIGGPLGCRRNAVCDPHQRGTRSVSSGTSTCTYPRGATRTVSDQRPMRSHPRETMSFGGKRANPSRLRRRCRSAGMRALVRRKLTQKWGPVRDLAAVDTNRPSWIRARKGRLLRR